MSLYSEKESDYFSSARIEILELLPKYSDRVLEVGCGSGKTLQMLKEKKYCMETLNYSKFIDKFNGSIDTLLIP